MTWCMYCSRWVDWAACIDGSRIWRCIPCTEKQARRDELTVLDDPEASITP